MTDSDLDCLSCGACCFSKHPDYIEVFEVDRARMDERAWSLTVEIGGRRFMRSQGELDERHCAALDMALPGSFSCSIYEMRPDPCRWLRVGCGECHHQRTHKLAWAAKCVEKLRFEA